MIDLILDMYADWSGEREKMGGGGGGGRGGKRDKLVNIV